jgi:hypothetical protein
MDNVLIRQYRLKEKDIIAAYSWLLTQHKSSWTFVKSPGTPYEQPFDLIAIAQASASTAPDQIYDFGIRWSDGPTADEFDFLYGSVIYDTTHYNIVIDTMWNHTTAQYPRTGPWGVLNNADSIVEEGGIDGNMVPAPAGVFYKP